MIASVPAAMYRLPMSERPPLTDDEAYERIHAALLALGREKGATVRADTSLKAARKALTLLQLGLLAAMEKGSDANAAVKAPDAPLTQRPFDQR
jgi:hypothetical protein